MIMPGVKSRGGISRPVCHLRVKESGDTGNRNYLWGQRASQRPNNLLDRSAVSKYEMV
jgi:hypothetical protein